MGGVGGCWGGGDEKGVGIDLTCCFCCCFLCFVYRYVQLLRGVRADEAVVNMLIPLHLSIVSPGGDRRLVTAVEESIEEKPESMTYSNVVRRLIAPSGRALGEENKERAATRGRWLLVVLGGGGIATICFLMFDLFFFWVF